MRTNKVTIRLTCVEEMGRSKELFFDKCLMLRTARNVGDIETINHTQLGALNRYPNSVKYEVIK